MSPTYAAALRAVLAADAVYHTAVLAFRAGGSDADFNAASEAYRAVKAEFDAAFEAEAASMGEPTTCPKCGKNLALVRGMRPSTTYQYRDIEKRRAYQRAYQKARRAKASV